MRHHGPLDDTERQRVAEVFLAHRDLIEAVARSVVRGDHAETAEVVQDVGVRLCQRLHQLRHPAAIRGWIARLTWRVAQDHVVRRDRVDSQRDPVDPDQVPDTTHCPERLFVRRHDLGIRVTRAIATLPPGQRAFVRLRLGHAAPSLRAIAREMGVSPSTVSRAARAASVAVSEALEDAGNTRLAEGRATLRSFRCLAR